MEDVFRGYVATLSGCMINVPVAGNYLFKRICDLKPRVGVWCFVNSKTEEETLLVKLSRRQWRRKKTELVAAVELEEVVLIGSLHNQIYNQSRSTASLSQGLNFSWRPASKSNILQGRSLLFSLSSLHTLHQNPPASFFLQISPHAHHLYTVNMMRHAINVYI